MANFILNYAKTLMIYDAMCVGIVSKYGDEFAHKLWNEHVCGQVCMLDEHPVVLLDLMTDQEIEYYTPFLHNMIFNSEIDGIFHQCEIRLRKNQNGVW